MNRMYSRAGVLCGALLLAASSALAWGPATHLMVGDQLSKKAGWKNLDEMYGATLPDFVNYMFSVEGLPLMYAETHANFDAVWQASGTMPERALAKGMITHNGLWGADRTAHFASQTLNPTKGYVITKAEMLAYALHQDPIYAALGIPYPLTVELAHPMVEDALEVLSAQLDPGLGAKLVKAAAGRDDAFPEILVNAYAVDFAPFFGNSETAAGAIRGSEAFFRGFLIARGTALQQDAATALGQIAEQNVPLAEGFAASIGVTLPEGFPVKALILNLLYGAVAICQDDFAAEIQRTAAMVEANLEQNGYRFPQY